MSLDVYLYNENVPPAIRVREDGTIRTITREEWDAAFPDYELLEEEDDVCVYTDNITHNLTKMADDANLYKALWRPDEIGIQFAAQLIQPLEDGLSLLVSNPSRFEEYNPKNGWGSYEGLVDFVTRYLEACRAHPSATIRTWR